VYYVYKTTNLKNGKVYIGITGRDLDGGDPYLGSGKHLLSSIKKYGKKRFTREILLRHEDLELVAFVEEELVDEEFVARKDTYNIVIGGGYPPVHKGEAHPLFGVGHSEESKKKMSDNSPDMSGKNNPRYGCKLSEETKKKMVENRIAPSGKDHYMYGRTGNKNHFYGGHHTEETKKALSEARRGEKNPMFGTKSPNAKRIEIDGIKYETQQEAADALGVERHTIWRWKKQGKHNIK